MVQQAGNVKPIKDRSMHVQAQAVSMLKKGEDRILGRRWQRDGDIEARNKLVESHIRFALKRARKFANGNASDRDVQQQAFMGLVKAAEKYDPDKYDFAFSTYAAHWIKAEVGQYTMNDRFLVKFGTTGEQKAIFFNLSEGLFKVQQDLNIFEIERFDEAAWQMLTDEINNSARKLKVSIADVKECAMRLQNGDSSLNAPVGRADGTASHQDFLVDKVPHAAEIIENRDEKEWQRELLIEAFSVLNSREQDIILQRRLSDEPTILEELGEKYDVSKERIRQLEMAGMKKLRLAFSRIASDKFGESHPITRRLEKAIENDPKFKFKL